MAEAEKSWVHELDMKMEKKQKTKLAHEAGAGSPCLQCDLCPGLELHFWRKLCKCCKCPQSGHDVGLDDVARFYLALGSKPELIQQNTLQNRRFIVDQQDLEDVPALFHGRPCLQEGDTLEFDWVPPGLDREGIFEYMSEMPKETAPITNTHGALHRTLRWQRQIPEYDIYPNAGTQHQLQKNNLKRYTDYINIVKGRAVGQAEVIRLRKTDRSESETYETQKPQLVGNPALTPKWLSNVSDDYLKEYNEHLRKIHCDGSAPVVTIDPNTGRARGLATPECYNCQTNIDIWNIAVYVEKNRQHLFWHPSCFKCFTCNKLLVDLIYFYHKEKFYCLRDYAQARGIPRCSSCDELIFNDQWTLAKGKDYHIEHFLCYHCEVPLADQDYVEEDEGPYCLACFHTQLAKICVACNLKIGPDEISCKYGDSRVWHYNANCFKCAYCNAALNIKEDVLFGSSENPTAMYCNSFCKAAALIKD